MSRRVRLLGAPAIVRDEGPVERPRGRKTWGVLAYLMLADGPCSRRRLADLLFVEALDPMRTLRWNLADLRRALGGSDSVAGDPVELRLDPDDEVDVELLVSRSWPDVEQLAGLGGELLEGLSFDGAPGYAAWLDLERHHLRAASEALLTELAVGQSVLGEHRRAAELAVRAIRLDELNADHHALLVRSLVADGDMGAARSHAARCAQRYREQLGVALPATIGAALEGGRERAAPRSVSRPNEIRAALDAGRAAISAGAVPYGLSKLREAQTLVSNGDDREALRAEVLLELGGSLVHSAGDRSVASTRCLHEAHLSAQATGDRDRAARAARELGFLHVQTGRRERADAWLDRAEGLAEDPVERARILGVRGMNRSDEARYDGAMEVCAAAVELAERHDAARPGAWSLSMMGRVHLLRGELRGASQLLDRAADLVARERWTAFSPWVEALRAEVELAHGDGDAAGDRFERAYALSRTLEDHCWIAMNARGIALARWAAGDTRGALEWVQESLRRSPWYLWVHAYALHAGVQIAAAATDERGARWSAELTIVCGRAQLRGFPHIPGLGADGAEPGGVHLPARPISRSVRRPRVP